MRAIIRCCLACTNRLAIALVAQLSLFSIRYVLLSYRAYVKIRIQTPLFSNLKWACRPKLASCITACFRIRKLDIALRPLAPYLIEWSKLALERLFQDRTLVCRAYHANAHVRISIDWPIALPLRFTNQTCHH